MSAVLLHALADFSLLSVDGKEFWLHRTYSVCGGVPTVKFAYHCMSSPYLSQVSRGTFLGQGLERRLRAETSRSILASLKRHGDTIGINSC